MTKARFEELEKRCSRLKKIRILRFVLGIAVMFLGGFGMYYGMYHAHLPSQTPLEKPEPLVQKKPEVVVTPPRLDDTNESNTSRIDLSALDEVTVDETLFLAPHVYKNEAKLPASETAEATRSLKEEHQWLKRYQATPNFENAYTLAHFYFERKAYSEAILWAKEANKHNVTSEKPWLIYAKAKFYLGDRAEAIRSLELFLSYIKSKEVEELLNFYKGQE